MNIGAELLNVPFPEMVKKLGMGIADAQFALDQASIKIAQLMSGFKIGDNGKLVKDDSSMIKLTNDENAKGHSLLELGFAPTFYQFVDTVIEFKMSISFSSSTDFDISTSAKAASVGFGKVAIASVNASYSQKYQYSAEGSSYMRTKLVTVPSPAIFEQKIREASNNMNENNSN